MSFGSSNKEKTYHDRFGNPTKLAGLYDNGKGGYSGYIEIKGELFKLFVTSANPGKKNSKGQPLTHWINFTLQEKKAQSRNSGKSF